MGPTGWSPLWRVVFIYTFLAGCVCTECFHADIDLANGDDGDIIDWIFQPRVSTLYGACLYYFLKKFLCSFFTIDEFLKENLLIYFSVQ